MREDQETDGPDDLRRLPGFEQRRYARDSGIRASRRASSWAAAGLVAAVAATTGYLAHSIPSSTTSTTTGGTTGKGTATPARKSTAVQPGAPAVSAPVVTSGGSGAAAGSAAVGRGADN